MLLLFRIGQDLSLILTEDRPPGLLVMLLEFLIHLFGSPMLIDYSVSCDVDTSAIHVDFTRTITRLSLWVVHNRPKLVELLGRGRFKYARLDLDPVHSKLFAEPLLFSLGVGPERNDSFYALVVQRINVLHFRIRSPGQVRRHLFSRTVRQGRPQKNELDEEVVEVHTALKAPSDRITDRKTKAKTSPKTKSTRRGKKCCVKSNEFGRKAGFFQEPTGASVSLNSQRESSKI
jgi:hypothetical protein